MNSLYEVGRYLLAENLWRDDMSLSTHISPKLQYILSIICSGEICQASIDDYCLTCKRSVSNSNGEIKLLLCSHEEYIVRQIHIHLRE